MPTPVELADAVNAALPVPSLANRALAMIVKARQAAASPRGVPGVPTGFKPLDAAIGGLQTGLHILAAEPGAGKTAFALNIARHAAASHGLPVVYASFDEMPERLFLKVMAARMGVGASEMLAGPVPLAALETGFAEHSDALRALCFIHADAKLSPAELVKQLSDRLQHHDKDIGLLVIDYLQPWAAAWASATRTDYRIAVGTMALELRKLANETGCPVLLVSAQNRSGQGTASMMSLRESSDLEYGADSILFITNDEAGTVGSGRYARTLTIAKNRFGPTDVRIPIVLEGRTQVMAAS